MNELTGLCYGRYIMKYTYDPAKINSLTEAGASKEEVLNYETPRSVIITGYHILYEYEVNGRTYVRADHKLCHRKDKFLALSEYTKYAYKVYYDPANPSVAQIGEKVGVIDNNGNGNFTNGNLKVSNVPQSNAPVLTLVFGILSLVLSFLVIPSLVLGPIGLTKGIDALGCKDPRKTHSILGVVFSGLGILFSIAFIIVWIAVLLVFIGN